MDYFGAANLVDIAFQAFVAGLIAGVLYGALRRLIAAFFY